VHIHIALRERRLFVLKSSFTCMFGITCTTVSVSDRIFPFRESSCNTSYRCEYGESQKSKQSRTAKNFVGKGKLASIQISFNIASTSEFQTSVIESNEPAAYSKGTVQLARSSHSTQERKMKLSFGILI